MELKIDTKEKFTVVTPILTDLTVNIAAGIADTCLKQLQEPVKNVVLQMEKVGQIEEAAALQLAELQQQFYEKSASFVICSLSDTVEAVFEKMELLDFLNHTPTESEAWDIVQMEEIERELLDSDDMEFENNPD
ncbi:MAG: STAS domain-containing protein [Bacteroidetes bacterium]|nr:STAS domain-containing protein [Bacteroidota bacterium]